MPWTHESGTILKGPDQSLEGAEFPPEFFVSWNRALTSEEIDLLAAGVHPTLIAPDSLLICYWPLGHWSSKA